MDMTGIWEALHREPFEPFAFRLADGRALPVPHPDFVALNDHRVVVLSNNGGWSVLEPLLISSLDFNGGATRQKRHSR